MHVYQAATTIITPIGVSMLKFNNSHLVYILHSSRHIVASLPYCSLSFNFLPLLHAHAGRTEYTLIRAFQPHPSCGICFSPPPADEWNNRIPSRLPIFHRITLQEAEYLLHYLQREFQMVRLRRTALTPSVKERCDGSGPAWHGNVALELFASGVVVNLAIRSRKWACSSCTRPHKPSIFLKLMLMCWRAFACSWQPAKQEHHYVNYDTFNNTAKFEAPWPQ